MATQQPRNTKQGARRSPVQAFALLIIPKHTDDVRPLPKRQEQALINLAKKAKKLLPIRALFSGPSGTGKTLAAEFFARKLEVTLCRFDVGAVVSNYIGETEKNLHRLFNEAEDQVRFAP